MNVNSIAYIVFGENRPSWFSKIIGDPQQYSQLPPKDGMINYACLVIRSLRWPGTIAACKVISILNREENLFVCT